VTVRAVIVGIESYDEPNFDVQAPAANALAMARWGLDHGITAQDIFLFVASADPAVLAAIAAMGINNRGATLRDVENALRNELPNVASGSKLLFYWSGHGMTDAKGQRLFFCSDYTARLTDRVFNATLFLRELRTEDYSGFRSQLVLADVCGTNSERPVRPAEYIPGVAGQRNQLTYFATPEGGYALAGTGEGAFTHHALKILGTFPAFPDFNEFRDRLNRELQASNLPRYLLDGSAEDEQWETRVGRAATSEDQTANSLIELLVGLEVPHDTALRHFRSTVAVLRNPRLLAAEGLTGMVRELSGLRDQTNSATHGLAQFVLRLRASLSADKVPKLDAWLSRWANSDVIEQQTRALAKESKRSALVVVVISDQRGEINSLEPLLRSLDLTQSRGSRMEPIPVRSWEEVDAAMQNILERITSEGFDDLEIHFIVDSTVFDRAFHRLRGRTMPLLGEEFGVVLHHRSRADSRWSTPKRNWEMRVSAVSCKATADLSWTRCFHGQNLPMEANLCLAGWTPNPPGKMLLNKLVMMGVPFIYWPHSEEEPDAEPDLAQILCKLGSLSEMPDAILKKRLSEAASSGSLLWDDVNFNPFGG